jgi:hypothetical protein
MTGKNLHTLTLVDLKKFYLNFSFKAIKMFFNNVFYFLLCPFRDRQEKKRITHIIKGHLDCFIKKKQIKMELLKTSCLSAH